MTLNKLTDSEKRKMIRLYRGGMSRYAIAKQLGRHQATVWRVISGETGQTGNGKPWRCPGCGGMVTVKECIKCRPGLDEKSRQKNERTAAHYWSHLPAILCRQKAAAGGPRAGDSDR